jgi:hypothetical protein
MRTAFRIEDRNGVGYLINRSRWLDMDNPEDRMNVILSHSNLPSARDIQGFERMTHRCAYQTLDSLKEFAGRYINRIIQGGFHIYELVLGAVDGADEYQVIYRPEQVIEKKDISHLLITNGQLKLDLREI